jgi:hypothetical protein
MRKALITAAALGALAVGGAAFAQAQNASSVVAPVVQQSQGQTGEHGSQANDTPDAKDVPTVNDTPDSGESDAGPANEVEDGS